MTPKTMPSIEISASDYLTVIKGGLIKISEEVAQAHFKQHCKLVNSKTKAYTIRRLHSIVGEYGYWEKTT